MERVLSMSSSTKAGADVYSQLPRPISNWKCVQQGHLLGQLTERGRIRFVLNYPATLSGT